MICSDMDSSQVPEIRMTSSAQGYVSEVTFGHAGVIQQHLGDGGLARDKKAPAVEKLSHQLQSFKENLFLLTPTGWSLSCEGCHAESAFPSSEERDPQAHARCHLLIPSVTVMSTHSSGMVCHLRPRCCVCELWGKTAEKCLSRRIALLLDVKQFPRCSRRTEGASPPPDIDEGTSDVLCLESDNECSDQE